MRLGVSMWSYFHAWRAEKLDLPGFVHEAKRVGAEGVELLDYFYKDVEADRAAAKQALDETGLVCSVFSVSNNFAKASEAERTEALNKIKFGVDEAVAYGAPTVRVFAGNPAEGISYDQARASIVSGLTDASRYAADKGIRLALENHGLLAGKARQVKEIIEEVRSASGCDALGANPDTGNFLLVNEISHESVAEVAAYAFMVHFKDFAPAPAAFEGYTYEAADGQRYYGTAIGEGAVDLKACVDALRAANFNGWLNVEYEAEEDPFTGVARSMENARRIVGQS